MRTQPVSEQWRNGCCCDSTKCSVNWAMIAKAVIDRCRPAAALRPWPLLRRRGAALPKRTSHAPIFRAAMSG
jgi:hypothetical protein